MTNIVFTLAYCGSGLTREEALSNATFLKVVDDNVESVL
jgi:hypothetical protein